MALTSILTLSGKQQGSIEGDCTQAGYEGAITVFATTSGIILPTNPLTGMPAGQRQHQPFCITKPQDKASPLLYQACATGEHMDKFELLYLRINEQGQEEVYFKVTLENAIIVKMNAYKPMVFLEENKPYSDMEEVSLAYDKITWEHVTEQKVASDSWTQSS